jgi:hypothetical protein
MSTLQADAARPNARHGHKPNGLASEAQCPYCGQPITRKEFREIQARIEAEEKARLAKLEKALAEKAQAEIHKAKLQAAEIAEKQIEKVKHDALVAVAETRRPAQLDRNTITKQMKEAVKQAKGEALATMPTKIAEAVAATKLEHAAEKLKLETALGDMQRRLQAKTAHALGEPAEVDLFAALETAFPDDSVSRVLKGQPGPDVVMEVIHSGASVGKIILDSKNHARWSNRFTSKLRADQLAEGADYAILSTNVFPAGVRELHIQDNVIVASPQRVVVLTHLLRRQIVENHRLRLTAAARDEKAERLLAYIVSPTCTDLLDRIAMVTADLAELDRTETAAHQKVWAKRADFIRAVADIHREFSGAVSTIIAGGAE